MKIEKDIEGYLIRKVRELGGECLKFPATYAEGIPDRLIILPQGRYAWVELKRPKGGVLAPLQKYQIKKLRALGCRVYVAKNYEEINKLIEEVLQDGLQTTSLSGVSD